MWICPSTFSIALYYFLCYLHCVTTLNCAFSRASSELKKENPFVGGLAPGLYSSDYLVASELHQRALLLYTYSTLFPIWGEGGQAEVGIGREFPLQSGLKVSFLVSRHLTHKDTMLSG